MANDPILTGQRDERWEWLLLDLDGQQTGQLDGVDSATLEWNNHSTIRSSGKLTYRGHDVDWLQVMVQPVYHVTSAAGTTSWPLGVFVPSTPGVNWEDVGPTEEVDLYDKLQFLLQDSVEETFTVPAGTNVVAQVEAIIASSAPGEIVGDDSDKTTASNMVWPAGTTKLTIVNDLLGVINYYSLWVDGFGRFRLRSNTGDAPLRWDFQDNHLGIYEPTFTAEQDLFNVPNRVVEVGQPQEENETVLIAYAENTDPDSPSSYPTRGRWITQVDQDVEAADQETLQAIANRRLVQLSSSMSTLVIKHALVPFDLNDAVTFRRLPADIDTIALVQSFSVDTSVGGMVTTSLRRL